MKKMAIISSYNELCGNATYTEVLRKEFSKYYNVDVLALRTDLLGHRNRRVSRLADTHIKEMAKKLKGYDYVNIQFEAGLYGTARQDIIRRIKWLIDACPYNMTFTMHRVDIAESIFDKGNLKQLLYGNFFKNLKNVRQKTYMAKLYQIVIRYIKRKAEKKNYNIIVHTKREKKNIQQLYGFEKVYDFPITFMDEKMRERKPDEKERELFRKKYGLNFGDKIIGLFGFVSEYKGHETAIRALKLLPAEYKIIIFGSQHPMSIMQNTKVDPYIDQLIQIITEDTEYEKNNIKGKTHEEQKLENRVFFAGSLGDEDFIDALYCCDFAVLPYVETNQSGSGIASLVLESKIKSLYSNNYAFFELKKYYPHSFESFDIGNYCELAYKILNYKDIYKDSLEENLKIYNLENNVLFQKKILEGNM